MGRGDVGEHRRARDEAGRGETGDTSEETERDIEERAEDPGGGDRLIRWEKGQRESRGRRVVGSS